MDAGLVLKISLAAGAALVLGWRIVDAHRRDRGGRAHMLDEFATVVQDAGMDRSPWGYPRLRGTLDGRPVGVDLIPDTLVQRALPTLYLEARWAQSHDGSVCVINEPVGTEYIFDADRFPTRVKPPPGWPPQTEVRAVGGTRFALLQRLAALDIDAFPSLKQICLTDRELKVTLRCAHGDRGVYRVLRSATFPPDSVSSALVNETLTLMRAIEETVGSPIEDAPIDELEEVG